MLSQLYIHLFCDILVIDMTFSFTIRRQPVASSISFVIYTASSIRVITTFGGVLLLLLLLLQSPFLVLRQPLLSHLDGATDPPVVGELGTKVFVYTLFSYWFVKRNNAPPSQPPHHQNTIKQQTTTTKYKKKHLIRRRRRK
jgi:hypothetical protein